MEHSCDILCYHVLKTIDQSLLLVHTPTELATFIGQRDELSLQLIVFDLVLLEHCLLFVQHGLVLSTKPIHLLTQFRGYGVEHDLDARFKGGSDDGVDRRVRYLHLVVTTCRFGVCESARASVVTILSG
jgi:hypothetical protein